MAFKYTPRNELTSLMLADVHSRLFFIEDHIVEELIQRSRP